MTAAQARIAETVESFYTDSNEEAMAGHAYKRAVEDLDTKTGRELDAPYRTTVLEPIQKLCAYFPNTNQAISKRHKKVAVDDIKWFIMLTSLPAPRLRCSQN